MSTLGLIAGHGEFPLLLAEQAQKENISVVAFAIIGETESRIEDIVKTVHWLEIHEVEKLIELLHDHHITEAVMAGKIHKANLIKNAPALLKQMPLKNIWTNVLDRRDDSLLLAVAERFEDAGVKLIASTTFMESFLAPVGVMTKCVPTDREQEDILFGFDMAKKSAALDIGQTIIVKNKAVMAVEAIEGTDAAIKRGALLGGDGVVVVKVSKPHQDMRFDVPVVGVETLEVMSQVKACVLALEAGKTLIMNKTKFVNKADQRNVCVLGVASHD